MLDSTDPNSQHKGRPLFSLLQAHLTQLKQVEKLFEHVGRAPSSANYAHSHLGQNGILQLDLFIILLAPKDYCQPNQIFEASASI